MLKCRLVLFFDEVRRLAPDLEWRFQLVTAAGNLSEEQILKDGWPAQFYTLTIRAVQKTARGSMDRDLGVDPRLASRFFVGEARRVVVEVRREFGRRVKWGAEWSWVDVSVKTTGGF